MTSADKRNALHADADRQKERGRVHGEQLEAELRAAEEQSRLFREIRQAIARLFAMTCIHASGVKDKSAFAWNDDWPVEAVLAYKSLLEQGISVLGELDDSTFKSRFLKYMRSHCGVLNNGVDEFDEMGEVTFKVIREVMVKIDAEAQISIKAHKTSVEAIKAGKVVEEIKSWQKARKEATPEENKRFGEFLSVLEYAFSNDPQDPIAAITPAGDSQFKSKSNAVPTPVDYQTLLRTKKKIDPDNKYIGSSVALLQVFEQIELLNKMPDMPVLIVGPTGAGKTEIARLIHDSSSREGKFVREQSSLVMAADASLPTARWIGHGKSSALPNIAPGGTDGLLQEASGGTIFVDEAADLPHVVQTLLLDVIDNKEISKPTGQSEPFKADVRLILATNNEVKIANKDEFRHDLLNRLTQYKLAIPPLDDRKEDIFEFVKVWREEHPVDARFFLALLHHSWEGNVRQLRNEIRTAIARTTKPNSPLTVEVLAIHVNDGVGAMSNDEAEIEIVKFLNPILENQGFAKGKKGQALQTRIVDLTGWSKNRVGDITKRIGSP